MKLRAFSFLIFSSLAFTSFSQADYAFERKDTIIVKNVNDTLKLAWAGGTNYAQFSNIDLNFDGIQDLFLFDRTGNKVLTYLHVNQTNSSQYTYAPEYESRFPQDMMAWALLKDYNCDGKQDLFTYTPGGIKVYTNTSTMATGISFQLFNSMVRSWQVGNWVNLYVSSVDLPGLVDMEGDGDLDVLTFGVFGTTMEYHRNFSVENGYGCDSMQYTMMNQCWGCFEEDAATNNVFLNDTCPNTGITNPEMTEIMNRAAREDYESLINEDRSASRHSGSCICGFDIDNSGIPDIILGDISFPNAVAVINTASTPNMNLCADSMDASYPSYSDPLILELFPCAYFVEINNDNKTDLVFSPQATGQSENAKSNTFYYNSNTTQDPFFNYVTGSLLQNEMIERGEGAMPVLFDYNGDGLADLFVANYGEFNSPTDTYISRIAQYENVGTVNMPVYNFVTANYENLDAVIGFDNLYPAFGDLDGDGDKDMMVGNDQGTLSYFQNTALTGNDADFTLASATLVNDIGATIDVGQFAAPFLVDLDRDGDNDLVIGNKSGRLTYYRNTGTTTAYNFKFITDTLGKLNVKEWWDNSGYSIPWFYDDNGQYRLFIGSKNGNIHYYKDIDANLNGYFTLVDSTYFEPKEGIRAACAVADVTGDGFIDMFTGNYRGGLTFWMGVDTTGVGISEEEKKEILLYPNPANETIIIEGQNITGMSYEIADISGKLVVKGKCFSNRMAIPLQAIGNGVYFIRMYDQHSSFTQKFIKAGN